jgi:PAS domain S-box-containing protein
MNPLPLLPAQDAVMNPGPPIKSWLLVPLLALAYSALAGLSLMLAAPSAYASPLYPPAGLALAAALVYGPRACAGVMLGALVANLGLALQMGPVGAAHFFAALAVGLGAALQAGVGAALIKRFVAQPVVLNAPRDILRFGLWGGALACVINPSVATPALLATGAVASSDWWRNWLTWWLGDFVGVVIAAPVVLSFIGLPRADWRPRRRTVAVPMLMAMLLLSLGVFEYSQLDQQRLRADFQRDADHLASEAQLRLSVATHALQAMHSSARPHGELDEMHLREASRWWLTQPQHLQATGYSEWVAEEQVLVRVIEPSQSNLGAVGSNEWALPALREAIAATRNSGQVATSAGVPMTTAAGEETGVVSYQALYAGQAADEINRRAQFLGVVFVRVVPERALAGFIQPGQQHLRWCLLDNAETAQLRRLAGPPGCEAWPTGGSGAFAAQRMLDLGGRVVDLRVVTTLAAMPGRQGAASGLLALMGLAAAAMMGALLLTITGQYRRTEQAVQFGTAELRREMAERTQAEEALRESEARLRTILDNVPLGVLFLDPQGHIIDCNPRLCAMVDRQPQSLRALPVSELVHSDDQALVRALRRDLLAAPTHTLMQQLRMQDVKGQPCHVRLSASALTDPDGRVVRMVGVLEDITDQLRLADADRQRQLAQAESHAKSEFVSRMSHELRTPLNAMIGFAQLLGLDQEPGLVAHQREWVQQIQRAGWHLLDMINETLDLARIESGHVQLTLAPVALQAVVDVCWEMLQTRATPQNIHFHPALQDDGLAVMGDSTRVMQVLSNLLSNAVKYNRPGGAVTLTAQRVAARADKGELAPEMVEIQVGDTGLGMTTEQLAALFQPYNRLGRESSEIEGTGIGLVICRRLCALMHGSLEVVSQAGIGTVFTLRLPAAAATPAPLARVVETSAAPYRARRIHYIEDNLVNIEVMRGIMLQRPQVALDTSLLGLDGLAAVRTQRPDLILLDMQLPDISGLEVLRHLKQDPATVDVPVVMVTADATDGHMQAALALGALHYVTKPVEVAPFLQTIDNILDNGQTQW